MRSWGSGAQELEKFRLGAEVKEPGGLLCFGRPIGPTDNPSALFDNDEEMAALVGETGARIWGNGVFFGPTAAPWNT